MDTTDYLYRLNIYVPLQKIHLLKLNQRDGIER